MRIKLRSADRAFIPRAMTRHKPCPVQAYYLYGKTCHIQNHKIQKRLLTRRKFAWHYACVASFTQKGESNEDQTISGGERQEKASDKLRREKWLQKHVPDAVWQRKNGRAGTGEGSIRVGRPSVVMVVQTTLDARATERSLLRGNRIDRNEKSCLRKAQATGPESHTGVCNGQTL